MKTVISLITVLFSGTILWAQNQSREAFIIQGEIKNCPEKYLKIFFQDEHNEPLTDTLHLDENGKFYLKTYKLTRPQRASIQQNNIQINDIFVAPGYNLTLTGNGKDFLTLFKSKKISGIGAESNKYRFMLDSVFLARNDRTLWYELNPNDLLAYISRDQKLKDSIHHAVFGQEAARDPYFNHFASMVKLDNTFNKLYKLTAYINMHHYSFDSSVSFIRNNFDNGILDNIYRDEYLISNDYSTGLIANEWLNYLVNLDYKKDSALRNREDYKLEKISTTYKGKVKEYVLYRQMEAAIAFCKSLKALNDYKDRFEPYISNIRNDVYKALLTKKMVGKENELMRTQRGHPAPPFTLQSNRGDIYSLEDFKGKVVYMDLWASWCAPCRAETPAFRRLYQKMKDNNMIEFLSIAVSDGEEEWKKALEQDKPEWIQLIDKDDVVRLSYVANAIPKFIIIDKKGNIVDLDAPWPGSGDKVEEVLKREIEK